MNYSFLKNWFNEIMIKTNGRAKKLKFYFNKPYSKGNIVIDNHGHTNKSDGERSNDFYIKVCNDEKIDEASITDHDSIGVDDEPNGFINGVEITSRLDKDNEVEILVYGYDQATAQKLIDSGEFPYLDRNFKYMRNIELTKKRIEICNKLKLTDKPFSLSDLLNIEFVDENGKTETLTLSQIGVNADELIQPDKPRPETIQYKDQTCKINYSFLMSKIYRQIISSENGVKFLKNKHESNPSFNPESPADFMKLIMQNKYGELYVEDNKYWPTVQQSIEFAKKTGGVAVLAHPFGYDKKINITTLELLDRVYKMGIDGIEAFHGYNQSDEVEFLFKYSYNKNLLVTMGSDTHGFISYQGGRVEPGLAPGVGYQARFTENNIDQEHLSLYNLFYYGTGAWRGEKEFDPDSIPPTIYVVFKTQQEMIKQRAEENKSAKNHSQPSL